MGVIAWLRERWRKRQEPLAAGNFWSVSLDGETVLVSDGQGAGGQIAIAEIASVIVTTNDSGPWGDDIYWLLYRADGTLGAGWPQGVTDEMAVIDRLMALPRFSENEMVRAMASTDNATFVLWKADRVSDRGGTLPSPSDG